MPELNPLSNEQIFLKKIAENTGSDYNTGDVSEINPLTIDQILLKEIAANTAGQSGDITELEERVTTISNKLNTKWELGEAIPLPDNVDLNNYTTPGNYYHVSLNVDTVTNIPENKGFRLTVLYDVRAADPNFLEQIFNPIGEYRVWKRYSTNGVWSDWKIVENVIGNLSDLTTTEKGSVVGAINEAKGAIQFIGTLDGDVLARAKSMPVGTVYFYGNSNAPTNAPSGCDWGSYIMYKANATSIIYLDNAHIASAYGINETSTSITWHIV